mmetsp:Transcript_32817/g.79479  ORF Transcript_32817/g.79479 Transcript_32817/m.79479 type:complete len:82 (+) Transcript_32817:197-442(+)
MHYCLLLCSILSRIQDVAVVYIWCSSFGAVDIDINRCHDQLFDFFVDDLLFEEEVKSIFPLIRIRISSKSKTPSLLLSSLS